MLKYLRTSENEYLLDSLEKYLVFYAYNPYQIEDEEYFSIVNGMGVYPLFKFYLLNEDESVNQDLTKYLVANKSGNLTIDYNNGVRRRLNLSLYMPNQKFPNNNYNSILWKGKKFKLEIGLKTYRGEYIKPCGIFILNDFSTNDNYESNIFEIGLVDKFGGLNNEVGGGITEAIEIPRGSNIKKVIQSLVKQYDTKPVIFDMNFNNQVTPYTISKSAGENSVGEIIIELAQIVGFEVYYNEYGYMVFTNSQDAMMINHSPVMWDFIKDSNMNNISVSGNPQDVCNIVVVEGGNINGMVMDATVKNTNIKSPTNIYIWEPKVYRMQDENITSYDLAKKRAEYELFKRSLFQFDISFNTMFIPHLDVNQVVSISSEYLHFNRKKCLITSISIPISLNSQYNITVKNIEEVAILNE